VGRARYTKEDNGRKDQDVRESMPRIGEKCCKIKEKMDK
jgi:hypothetical protein